MDKKLTDYLLDVRKEHDYTIRVAIDVMPTDNQIARMEANLKKYDLISISKPKKTIWQPQAYGFANATYKECLIFKIKTGLPASNFYLGREVAKSLNTTENLVVAHETGKEPQELNLEKDKNYKAGAPIDVHTDHSQYMGEKFKENFLKTIISARKEEHQRITKTAEKPKNTKKKK